MKGQMDWGGLIPQTPIKILIFGPCCKMILGMCSAGRAQGTKMGTLSGFWLEHRPLSVTMRVGKVLGNKLCVDG